MSSRLDLHEELIVRELLAGRSYTKIASDLVNMGCQTTRVNLAKWAKTRAKKLLARQQLVNPQAFFAPPAPISAAPAATIPAAPVPRAPVLAPAVQKHAGADEEPYKIAMPKPPALSSDADDQAKSDIQRKLERIDALQREHEEKQLLSGKITNIIYTPEMAAISKRAVEK